MTRPSNPPPTAPHAPRSPIDRATIYVNPGSGLRRLEGRLVTWAVKNADSTGRLWSCKVTYLGPKARTRSSLIQGFYPCELAILEGWDHLDPPARPRILSMSCFAGQPYPPSRDPIFDTFLSDYLAASGATLLADFRNPIPTGPSP